MARVLVVEHEADAGAGLVGERLAAAGIALDIVGPDVGLPLPETVDGYDGLVVLGGTPGPTDDEDAPWLPGARALIADALHRDTPLLGVCLGAELLAVVAGGAVGAATRGPEVGLVTVEPTDDAALDPLLSDLAEQQSAFQWHFLEILDLPPGSRSLAASETCPNQAFRVGERAWGLQFHLEALAPTAQAWVDASPEDLVAAGVDGEAIVAEMREAEPRLRAAWEPVADRFGAIVLGATG